MCVIIVYKTTYFTEPSALKVTTTRNIGDLSIVVQWNEIDDFLPTTYIVTWTNGTNSIQSHTLIEQSSYTITGLIIDTVYTVTVTTTNRCSTGLLNYRTNVSFPTGRYHYQWMVNKFKTVG